MQKTWEEHLVALESVTRVTCPRPRTPEATWSLVRQKDPPLEPLEGVALPTLGLEFCHPGCQRIHCCSLKTSGCGTCYDGLRTLRMGGASQ